MRFRYWVVGMRNSQPFAYDTGSNDAGWAEAVLSDVRRWYGVTEAKLEEREVAP